LLPAKVYMRRIKEVPSEVPHLGKSVSNSIDLRSVI